MVARRGPIVTRRPAKSTDPAWQSRYLQIRNRASNACRNQVRPCSEALAIKTVSYTHLRAHETGAYL
eukprot:7369854-Pyramimonas_sp.AAC.1